VLKTAGIQKVPALPESFKTEKTVMRLTTARANSMAIITQAADFMMAMFF